MTKNLYFDYHVDISDLVADKSNISGKSQWIHEYDRQAHRTNHGFFPRGTTPKSKSAVIHYLERDTITVKEVIDTLQNGEIPE